MTQRIAGVLIVLGGLLGGLLISRPAAAQGKTASHGKGALEFGLRLGYAIPFGKQGRTAGATNDVDVDRTIKGAIPLGFDAGYVITPNIYVGFSIQYGFGFLGSNAKMLCEQSGISCSTDDTRL